MQIVGRLETKKSDERQKAGFFGMALSIETQSASEILIQDYSFIIKLNENLIIEALEK